MAIDKKPIQDMPNKAFGDKHFASEFNTVKKSLLDIIDAVNEIPEIIESDFQGNLAPNDPAPTVDGSYRPSVSSADPGTVYPNAGNLKARDGYSTYFYKKGSVWTLSEVKIPGNTAKQVYDPSDNTNPATMKAAADRWDKTNVALKSFVEPTELGPWESLSLPSGETAGAVVDINNNGIGNQYGAYGDIMASSLAGISGLRFTGEGFDQFGNSVAWWLGFKADGTFDVLKSGRISSGTTEIKLDEKYIKYRYSRPTWVTSLQKQAAIPVDVKVDSVFEAIKAMGSGYSGVLDLATLGLKESNTAAANTSIINQAIEDQAGKSDAKIIKFPGGSFAVNEITMKPGTALSGAGRIHTRLYTPVGSSARFIINIQDGQAARGQISDIFIDADNTTEGAIYLNNVYNFTFENMVVYGTKQYLVWIKGGLMHTMRNIYFKGGDIGLKTSHLTAFATNLCTYDNIFFVKQIKKCVELNAGSNYRFTSCVFEDSGTSGDETTGGVHAIGLSPYGEGVDVSFNNCWSEGVRGGYIFKFENCYGNSVIRDCMLGNGGNGAGTIANAIVNLNSRVLLSGATRFSTAPDFQPFPTNIRAVNGFTYVDNPNINIGTNNVGTIQKAQYL
ncbi:glycosyl hydrolase family 28-related protein [Chryseobacterium culicis]|uniref:glycosyl hydrolase family 28-related protein n=1 Tax=Chryseobacterium culicis TaxID=680127 RepID=UPI001873F321|nr:glycosyl hydrolase family 28-related protein [Chryseobacterium culicis]MBE4949896.1 hypothetical protein [Chryseobacterium culicis]